MNKKLLSLFVCAFTLLQTNVFSQCTPTNAAHTIGNPFHEPGANTRFFGFMCNGHTDLIADSSALGDYRFRDGDGYGIKLIAGSTIDIMIQNCADTIAITVNDTTGCVSTIISGAYSPPALNNTLLFTATYTGIYRIVFSRNGVCGTAGTIRRGDVEVLLTNNISCPAPLANDDICSALTVTLNTPVTGSTETADLLDPMDSAAIADGYTCSQVCNNTLWYKFIPATTGSYDFTTVSPTCNGLRIAIGIFRATSCSAGGFLSADCIAGATPGNTLTSSRTLNAGTTYYLMIDGTQNSYGSFGFTISPTPPPPANDSICGAVQLVLNVPYSDDNTYALAADPRDNDATAAGYACSPPGNTLWYKFVPAITTNYKVQRVSPAGNGLHSWLGMFSAASCSSAFLTGTCLQEGATGATQDDWVIMNAGTTYYFMMDGYAGDVGPYSIEITLATGVNYVNGNNAVMVMPNPATDFCTIQFSKIADNNTIIEVKDLAGRTLINSAVGNVSASTINLSQLAAGTYFIKVSNGKEIMYVSKLVKN